MGPAVLASGRLPWVLGAGLGFAAFLTDQFSELGSFVGALVSSGAAWGFAAVLAGYSAIRRDIALRSAAGTLLLATATYYVLALVVSERWSMGQTESGDSSGWLYLVSEARAWGFWSAASVCAGLLLGWLGHLVASPRRRQRSIAAGSVLGMLTGEGIYMFVWTALKWLGPIDTFIVGKLINATVGILVAIVGIAVLLLRRGRKVAWAEFGAAAAISVGLNVGLWHLIQSARLTL